MWRGSEPDALQQQAQGNRLCINSIVTVAAEATPESIVLQHYATGGSHAREYRPIASAPAPLFPVGCLAMK